jgi:putative endonuclease
LKEHNRGRVKSTKAYMPWEIIYKARYNTKQEAYTAERRIKSMKNGVQFRELLGNTNLPGSKT